MPVALFYAVVYRIYRIFYKMYFLRIKYIFNIIFILQRYSIESIMNIGKEMIND